MVYPSRQYTKSPGTATAAPTPSGIRRHVCPDFVECACHRSYKLRTVWSQTAPYIPFTSGPVLTSSPTSDTVTTRPPARRLRLTSCGKVGGMYFGQTGLFYRHASCHPHCDPSGAPHKSCPNHRGRTCSAAVRGLFGIDWLMYPTEKFASNPGNGHTLATLSRPGRPYSYDVLFLRTPVLSVSFFNPGHGHQL